MKFTPVTATAMSTSRRKLIYGVGINDANYNVTYREHGRLIVCPLYNQWKSMLQRCFCPVLKQKYPTYESCTVVPEWLKFSAFLAWAEHQDWQGKHLDKDLLVPGNKMYGPETCLWVDPNINRLLINSKARKGDLPVGISLLDGKYHARMSVHGSSKSLGIFSDLSTAVIIFNEAKAAHITDLAKAQACPRLHKALLNIARNVKAGTFYN